MNNDKFWINDITVLYKDLFSIFPDPNTSPAQKSNALTRLCFYIIIFILLFAVDKWLIIIPLIVIICIIYFYYNTNNQIHESFKNNRFIKDRMSDHSQSSISLILDNLSSCSSKHSKSTNSFSLLKPYNSDSEEFPEKNKTNELDTDLFRSVGDLWQKQIDSRNYTDLNIKKDINNNNIDNQKRFAQFIAK